MRRISYFFLFIVLLTGCSHPEGEFAFRSGIDNRFKRMDGIPEFPQQEKVDWCFAFKKDYGKRDIGVIVMKKEIVWVDVVKQRERIDSSKRVIFGTIEGYTKGRYKLILTDNNEIIGEKEFIVYSEETWE